MTDINILNHYLKENTNKIVDQKWGHSIQIL